MAREKWFKLEKEEFSKIDKEWRWTYLLLVPIIFNEQTIKKITITDHYKLEHGNIMTDEKILEIMKKLSSEIKIMKPEPKKKPTWPNVFVPKGIEYEDKRYLIVFWFERSSSDWLWVRDCYPI